MHIEIDQSGRVEYTGHDTIFAFSDAINRAIRIPAQVKRDCQSYLRSRARTKATTKTYWFKIFAAAVFLLIQDHLDQLDSIKIDTEFEGQEVQATIKNLLLNHIWKQKPLFDKRRITFRRLGKRSKADQTARAVWEGKRAADRVVTYQELLKLFQ